MSRWVPWVVAGVALIASVPLVPKVLDLRSTSFRSIYARKVKEGIARTKPLPAPPVREDELAALPPPVAKYLRRAGVVGRPHVRSFHVKFRAEMKPKPDAGWMSSTADQYEFFDPAMRLFLMRGAMGGLPFEGLHVYEGSEATFRVRAVSMVDIVDAKGPEMNKSETVTLFNDMVVLAPATLLRANVSWHQMDDRHVRGTFTNAGNTISALLTFDEAGDLVGFVSNDRYLSADGKKYELHPWSTPMSDYKDFGVARIAAKGVAIWEMPDGAYPYGRFEVVELEYNVDR